MTTTVGSPSIRSTRATNGLGQVRHAIQLVLGLVLLVGVACSSPSASEAPPG